MKFLLIPPSRHSGEGKIISFDRVYRIVEGIVYRVPFAEGEFKHIAVIDNEVIPVLTEEEEEEIHSIIVVADTEEGDKIGFTCEKLPETLDLDEESALSFAQSRGLKIL